MTIVYQTFVSKNDTGYTQPLLIDRLLAYLRTHYPAGHATPVRNRALAAEIDCSPGSISPMLWQLHHDGHIEYTPAPLTRGGKRGVSTVTVKGGRRVRR